MHHRVSLALRQRDIEEAETVLTRLATVTNGKQLSEVYSGYYYATDIESDQRIFADGYKWAMEQYLAKGDNANAAKMKKQYEHWIKPVTTEA